MLWDSSSSLSLHLIGFMSEKIKIALISGSVSIILALITTSGTVNFKTDDAVQRIENQKIQNLPVGSVISSALSPIEMKERYGEVWIIADGSEINKSSKYFQYTNEERIPDLRGMFVRGMNHGRDDEFADPETDRELGSSQEYSTGKHTHRLPIVYNENPLEAKGWALDYHVNNVGLEHGYNADSVEEDEARPNNISLYYYIKID